jgi:uncharacterized protein (TIGR03067 family)
MIRHARWIAPVLLIALTSPLIARGADDAKVSGDLKKMQGTWVGKNAQGDEFQWVIEGDVLKATVGDGLYVCTITLDSKAEPLPTIDLKITEGPEDSAGKSSMGIYKLDGDSLKFCVSHPGVGSRPTEFKAEPGATSLFSFKRMK